MKSKFRILALFVVLVMIFTGCAYLQGATGKSQYGQTLATYNDMVDSFRYYYNAADDTTKAELNKNVRPALLQLSFALDQWKVSQDDALRADSVIALQRRAISLLLQYGVIKTKEVK